MSIINEKQSYLNDLCKKFNVAQLYVFGSIAKEKTEYTFVSCNNHH